MVQINLNVVARDFMKRAQVNQPQDQEEDRRQQKEDFVK